jgi:hypothetical protein
MTARRAAIVMSDIYRLATGNALQPDDAIRYLRDPKTFCHLVESSGVLEDPLRRAALVKAIQKEEPDGL